MATDYEQARSVAAVRDGDLAAADEVKLALPETGFRSTAFALPAEAACCGGQALKDKSACCAPDEAMKLTGGCGDVSAPAVCHSKASCCA